MASACIQSLNTYGTFREETGNAVNDPYQDPANSTKSSRLSGKQFAVPHPKPIQSGPKAADELLSKPPPYECDPYLDPYEREKVLNKHIGVDKSLHNKPFVPTGDSKKSCGAGSKYGCIGSVILDYDPPARPKTAPVESRKKIYTSPPRRAGFGCPLQDRTLGPVEPYMPDEYERARILEKQLRKDARQRIPKAFVSTSHGDRLFTSSVTLYSTSSAGSSVSRRPSTAPKIWRPSSPPKRGAWYDSFSSVGRTHIPDPIHEAPYRAKTKDGSLKPFKPASGSKQRLSMWTPNPFSQPARPPADTSFTLM